jgi:hypothetical protein
MALGGYDTRRPWYLQTMVLGGDLPYEAIRVVDFDVQIAELDSLLSSKGVICQLASLR